MNNGFKKNVYATLAYLHGAGGGQRAVRTKLLAQAINRSVSQTLKYLKWLENEGLVSKDAFGDWYSNVSSKQGFYEGLDVMLYEGEGTLASYRVQAQLQIKAMNLTGAR